MHDLAAARCWNPDRVCDALCFVCVPARSLRGAREEFKIRRQKKQADRHERPAQPDADGRRRQYVRAGKTRQRRRGRGWESVFGAVAGAGDPDEEIVVQKVVPTRPELSLEIGVLWLGLGGGGWMSISLSLSRALAVAIRSLAPPALPLGWRETGSPVARHLSDSDSPPLEHFPFL
jgi:hypothetical protein